MNINIKDIVFFNSRLLLSLVIAIKLTGSTDKVNF